MYSQTKTYAVNTAAFGLVAILILGIFNAVNIASLVYTIVCSLSAVGSVVMLIAFVESPTSFVLKPEHFGAVIVHAVTAMSVIVRMGEIHLAASIMAGASAMSVIWLFFLAFKAVFQTDAQTDQQSHSPDYL